MHKGEAAAFLRQRRLVLPQIPVSISARHVHLSQETIERLFGAGHRLHVRDSLSQPGQYAAQETITLIGPRAKLEHVRILGPPRAADQVEVSRTDEVLLGRDAPLRLSGDLDATPGIELEGPTGRVTLSRGVICALRHIHVNPQDAKRLGIRDHDVVEVSVGGNGRNVVFGDVIVRVSPDYCLELHLDTDEGNAAGVCAGTTGRLLGPRS